MPNLPYDYDQEQERQVSCRACGEPTDFMEMFCVECEAEREAAWSAMREDAYWAEDAEDDE